MKRLKILIPILATLAMLVSITVMAVPVTAMVAPPPIDLETYVNGDDADAPTGPIVAVGSTVTFDFVVTAEDVRAYKPAHPHFEQLLFAYSRSDEVLHVAQSLFHDGVPTGQMGIAYVWINRYNDANETTVRPLATYSDLACFAGAASD